MEGREELESVKNKLFEFIKKIDDITIAKRLCHILGIIAERKKRT